MSITFRNIFSILSDKRNRIQIPKYFICELLTHVLKYYYLLQTYTLYSFLTLQVLNRCALILQLTSLHSRLDRKLYYSFAIISNVPFSDGNRFQSNERDARTQYHERKLNFQSMLLDYRKQLFSSYPRICISLCNISVITHRETCTIRKTSLM